MNVLKICNQDVANGPGIRVSVWCSGCSKKCPECHNPETWDKNRGKALDEDLRDLILQKCLYATGLTITGGDPLEPENEEGTILLARDFKDRYPNKDIWVWTGETLSIKDLTKYKDVDVIVDGPYNHKLRNVSHPYAGSSNQRVIDVKQSLEKGEIVCLDFLKCAKAIYLKKE